MSSGSSFGSSQWTQRSRSAEDDLDLDLQAEMEKRRKRRKESNRESARRSRLRKQQHHDDLTSQVDQLKGQNKQLNLALSTTSQNLVAVQAQNSVLQTQRMELASRLGALTEILWCISSSTGTAAPPTNPAMVNGGVTTTWSWSDASGDILGASAWNHQQQQPIDAYRCYY
ncbi:bZIP transcription factor 44 [Zea mays]|uniref:BZIP transcription factor 11 n=2 Tax=Zea mays TaxID=4577 RepID=C0HIB3_MAIZE|eukprot:NP_001167995.1 putative bZIP transcription factor superfamily protein [Zea mays]